MNASIIQVTDDFWNIRGEFRVGGVLNIGTQASLIRCRNGKLVLLDAYTLPDQLKSAVDELSHGGRDIEAIINLHPFHTVHVRGMHQQYPDASLYGTQRHLDRFPDLPWQSAPSESAECAARFAEDLEFSVPAGVDFISANEHLHFSSVLAYHRNSRTIHADDTLMYLKLPGVLGRMRKPELAFHPTLAMTLEKRAGAAAEFRAWAEHLATQWGDAENLCAAHSAALLARHNTGASVAQRLRNALQQVEGTLRRHQRRHG